MWVSVHEIYIPDQAPPPSLRRRKTHVPPDAGSSFTDMCDVECTFDARHARFGLGKCASRIAPMLLSYSVFFFWLCG